MPVDISNLKIELLTGSYAAVYSGAISSGDVNTLFGLVNTLSAISAFSLTISRADALTLQQCVVATEYAALTQVQRDLWNAIVTTATGGISISNTVIRGQITNVWGAGTVTRSNLVSAQTRPCTRGESLFGEGTVVDTNVIYVALHS